MQRLEPITSADLGEYADALKRWKVYGLLRREHLNPCVLEAMQRRRAGISQGEIEYLRIRKSRRWMLPSGFPQVGWEWKAAFDFGPFKSDFNGKHDLDGGRMCDLCHTWMRIGHLLAHTDWPHGQVIVGQQCAILLSDVDPDWAEKKLRQEFVLRRKKQEEERRRRMAEEEALCRREAEAQREADAIAAAMLRDYALRTQEHRVCVVPLIPGQDIVEAAVDSTWQETCRARQRVISTTLPTAVSNALRQTGNGNYTFRTEITGIPISGTIYRYGGGWKAVINRPHAIQPEHSDGIFSTAEDGRVWMLQRLDRLLGEYVTTLHAKRNYPWENTLCLCTA